MSLACRLKSPGQAVRGGPSEALSHFRSAFGFALLVPPYSRDTGDCPECH